MDDYQRKMMLVQAQEQYSDMHKRIQNQWGSYSEAQKTQAKQYLIMMRKRIGMIAGA